jgi:hypothetical protein
MQFSRTTLCATHLVTVLLWLASVLFCVLCLMSRRAVGFSQCGVRIFLSCWVLLGAGHSAALLPTCCLKYSVANHRQCVCFVTQTHESKVTGWCVCQGFVSGGQRTTSGPKFKAVYAEVFGTLLKHLCSEGDGWSAVFRGSVLRNLLYWREPDIGL